VLLDGTKLHARLSGLRAPRTRKVSPPRSAGNARTRACACIS